MNPTTQAAPPNTALNTVIEIKPSHKWINTSIEEQASCISRLFFIWANEIINFGNKKPFEDTDLFEVPKTLKYAHSWGLFTKDFYGLESKTKGKVRASLFKLIRKEVLIGLTCSFMANMVQFAGPYLLKEIIFYVADPTIPEWEGYLWAFLLFLTYAVRAILNQISTGQLNTASFKSAACLQALVMDKLLRLKSTARGYLTTGRVMNVATVDTFAVYNFFQMAMMGIIAPLTVLVAVILVITQVGPIGLVGMGVALLGSWASTTMSRKYARTRSEMMQFGDQRSKLLSEFIGGIRIIKYYGWEKYVMERIRKIRAIETKFLLLGSFIRAFMDFIVSLMPLAINVLIFALYVVLGNNLTPATAFATLSLFNIMAGPLRMITFVVMGLGNASVALKRLQHYSEWEEYQKYPQDETLPQGSMKIEGGTFGWETNSAKEHYDFYIKHFEHKFQSKGCCKRKEKADPKSNGQEANSPTASPTRSPSKKEEAMKEEKPLIDDKLEPKDFRILKDVNITIEAGEFVAVIGKVGSGKTSLISALLGEMDMLQGKVRHHGSIAYVPQQSWLMNTTLRDNITFGKPYEEEKYKEILKICELEPDIAVLPGGDLTEIGERGINLSGGQKQRVSLARASYADADIYLIDDCLSALDAHVGREIFKNLIRNKLRHKTIVFVTHALQYIEEADRIVFMVDGKIKDIGNLQELKSRSDTDFNNFIMHDGKEEANKGELAQSKGPVGPGGRGRGGPGGPGGPGKKPEGAGPPGGGGGRFGGGGRGGGGGQWGGGGGRFGGGGGGEETKKRAGALSSTEVKATGSIPWKVYSDYALSGGKFNVICVMTLFVIAQAANIINTWWLGMWSTDAYHLTSDQYIMWYAIIAFLSALLIYFRTITFSAFTRISAINLQKKIMYSIFRSPMTWFDTTPTGRILSRVNKDQDDINMNLPWALQMALQQILLMAASLILIGVITPLFFILAFLMGFYYIRIVRRYLKATRELKRIQSISRSPYLVTISEVANGYMVIRAHDIGQIFLKQLEVKFDKWIKAGHNTLAAQRWIGLRSDVFAAFIIGFAAVFAALSRHVNYSHNPGVIGLSLTYALQMTSYIAMTVRLMAEAELQMNAVERVLEYINKPDQEAPWEDPQPKSVWPSKGEYEAKDLAYQYRPELPFVLNSISFSINRHEKIGVVGRTGSGKSTLTLGMLRILELAMKDGKKGSIVLDSTNIADLGLHAVRRNITIIPQDPMLFTGSVRSNIDPFNEFTDDQIIDALKKCHIWDVLKVDDEYEEIMAPWEKAKEKKEKELREREKKSQKEIELQSVDSNKLKLNMKISDGGNNFSLGQRQLLCMARAMIRRSKVLIMDEATASIDEMTDQLIQTMIKTEFKDTTVITIAHRLNTIITYDKILVLDNGNIIEFDTPTALVEKPDGTLSGMVKQGGIEYERKLRAIMSGKVEDLKSLPASPEKVNGENGNPWGKFGGEGKPPGEAGKWGGRPNGEGGINPGEGKQWPRPEGGASGDGQAWQKKREEGVNGEKYKSVQENQKPWQTRKEEGEGQKDNEPLSLGVINLQKVEGQNEEGTGEKPKEDSIIRLDSKESLE